MKKFKKTVRSEVYLTRVLSSCPLKVSNLFHPLVRVLSLNGLLNEVSQSYVSLGQTLAVMRAQRHLHAVVDVEPLGMVVHLVRLECHASHEPERLVEVLELERLLDGVSTVHHLPTGRHEVLQLGGAVLFRELDSLGDGVVGHGSRYQELQSPPGHTPREGAEILNRAHRSTPTLLACLVPALTFQRTNRPGKFQNT